MCCVVVHMCCCCVLPHCCVALWPVMCGRQKTCLPVAYQSAVLSTVFIADGSAGQSNNVLTVSPSLGCPCVCRWCCCGQRSVKWRRRSPTIGQKREPNQQTVSLCYRLSSPVGLMYSSSLIRISFYTSNAYVYTTIKLLLHKREVFVFLCVSGTCTLMYVWNQMVLMRIRNVGMHLLCWEYTERKRGHSQRNRTAFSLASLLLSWCALAVIWQQSRWSTSCLSHVCSISISTTMCVHGVILLRMF